MDLVSSLKPNDLLFRSPQQEHHRNAYGHALKCLGHSCVFIYLVTFSFSLGMKIRPLYPQLYVELFQFLSIFKTSKKNFVQANCNFLMLFKEIGSIIPRSSWVTILAIFVFSIIFRQLHLKEIFKKSFLNNQSLLQMSGYIYLKTW